MVAAPLLSLATTNHEAEVYRDSIRQIEVDSNQFINGFHGAIGNSIWAQSIGDDTGYLSIYGNHFAYDATDNLNALIQLNSLNFDSVNVSCNTVTPNFTELNGINYLPPATSTFIETTNTWNTDNCKTPTSNTYYVTPDALNTGTGAKTCPWVLDTAVVKAMAGDIVYVLAGDYGAKTLTFPNSGTANAPIYFIGCTDFPTTNEAGKTNISINFPLTSFEHFKNDEISNYSNVMPLLNGITRENIALKIGNRSYLNIQNFAITKYHTGIQSAVAGVASEHITLKNIIGSDFANTRSSGCGCEEIRSGCPQKLGYGLEIYGNHHRIDSCIIADASAYNIAVWGSYNEIKNCRTYGTKGKVDDLFDPTDYYIEIGGYNNVIGTGTTVNNCIAVREDGMTDLCHKGKGIGIKRGQKNTITNCTTTDLDNEGFYAFGLTTTGNIFKNCQTNDDNRDGNALAIREGANKNSFINCTINDAGIGVRFKRDGGGHQNLFLNCYFNRPKVHVQIDKYAGCSVWTNCTIYADCETCEEKSKLNNNLINAESR
ncbi:MAG: hypothetical protein AB8G86_27050 [Saprospiraceae bacterium]